MKYMSLFALCTALVLVTGCGWNSSNKGTCCPEGTATTSTVETTTVEVQEEGSPAEGQTPAGKENLAETPAAEAMENK